jgi:hypothetical protein
MSSTGCAENAELAMDAMSKLGGPLGQEAMRR